MNLCGWIVFGFLAGLIARAVMPGTQKMGLIRTTLLGIVGSFVGGFAWSLWRGYDPLVLRSSSFIGSVIGALIVLVLFGLASRRR